MAGHQDPRLLYSISGIKAYHLQNGEESSLTPSGAQTLSLLMVPTSSPFADPTNTPPLNETPEDDFYLHLNLPPELDLPLPATTQIYHQPPRSYLIPRWDLGPDSGAFTRIEFPPIGTQAGQISQEDIDTFETILAQCTAFLERASPPQPGKSSKAYNPADFAPGEAYAFGTGKAHPGQIVLVDEDDGSVVGELAEGANIVEDPKLKHGSKTPVEILVSPDGERIDVSPISEEYLRMARHPAYQSSSMVQNAAAASRLIVTTSSYLSNMMTSGAGQFVQKTKPSGKPMTFTPTTHERVRKINNFTQSAAGLSAKTLGQAGKIAQNVGATLSRRKPNDKGDDFKPGLLNKSLIAFSTIADGIAHSGKHILTSGGAAASTVVGHRYGAEAGGVAAQLAGGVKNVGLVYIDVTGVSRRAVLKGVAKGLVVGKVKGGGEVVVGAGDGGVIPEGDLKKVSGSAGSSKDSLGQVPIPGPYGQPGQSGYGSAPPPSYSSGAGDNPPGGNLHGQYAPEKR